MHINQTQFVRNIKTGRVTTMALGVNIEVIYALRSQGEVIGGHAFEHSWARTTLAIPPNVNNEQTICTFNNVIVLKLSQM